MKISHNWLQDFVNLKARGIGVDELSDTLAMIGLAVEGVDSLDGDYLLNLEITSNRPDCLNYLGVAREIAAYYRQDLLLPDFSDPAPNQQGPGEFPTSVQIEAPDLCPRYAARVLAEVRIEASPDWLQKRLESVGQRPINNVVDITNYVLLSVGHPLHAFDYHRLEEHRIVVRRAGEGESLITLDGVQRQLDPSMLAICDAACPVALAGVMGGEDSEISTETKAILLESAYFDPATIRATSRKLGLRTEAAYRFERGADPEMPVQALNLACRMILEIAGGRAVSPIVDNYPSQLTRPAMALRSKRIRQVTGISLPSGFVTETLTRLGFEATLANDDHWEVRAPSFRVDAALEDDLVEEVIRHHGYNKIESTYPAPEGPGSFLGTSRHDQLLIDLLKSFGFFEAVGYVFSTPGQEADFWGETPSMVSIENPLTEEDTHLRTSLVPQLVGFVRHNLNYGNVDVRLFEIGKAFFPDGTDRAVREEFRLGLAATGSFYRPFWGGIREEFNFYHLKGAVDTLLNSLGHRTEYRKAPEVPFLHPGVSARVTVAERPLGVLGELHPRLTESFKFPGKVFIAELDLEWLYAQPLAIPRHAALNRFPSVQRDLSFVVDKSTEYDTIVSAVKGLNIPDLKDVQLLDLYLGSKLPPGKVSVAVRLTFTNPSRTLTQEEVHGYSAKVMSVLKSNFDAEQRA
jgi:phenylalanyl-tRNA synthetase beta chain